MRLRAYPCSQPIRKGWGGMKSTLTIRILEERGLAMVTNWRKDGWVASLTKKGRELLRR